MRKMYFTLKALVIFSCICSKVYSTEQDTGSNDTDTFDENNRRDCSLWASENDSSKMPIVITSNGRNAKIIDPDSRGRLRVRFMENVRMACVKTKFASFPTDSTEVIVTCMGGDSLKYLGKSYKFDDFKCAATPKSELKVTKNTCKDKKYVVAMVGFQTEHKFFDLYSVCFDKSTKNSLYSWYYSRSPYFNKHQKSDRPSFINTRELYGNTNVNKKYSFNEQFKTMAKILGSEKQAAKYFKKGDNKHFLSRGHFAPKADFFFAYEQSATFYYANVAPQWQIFNGNIWADVEEMVRQKMGNASAGHLVVTGTYGNCTLPDVNGIEQPLYLDPATSIPVPLFYWKLLYNFEEEDGLVYIGLNNPYKKIYDDAYICPNVCPKTHDDHNDANKGLVYCCTMESFEKVYGKFDSVEFDAATAGAFSSQVQDQSVDDHRGPLLSVLNHSVDA